MALRRVVYLWLVGSAQAGSTQLPRYQTGDNPMDQPIHERLKHVSACHTATCYNERHALSPILQEAQQQEGKPRVRRSWCISLCGEHVMTEPVIEQQETELNQVIEQVKDLLGYGRLKAARELLERALRQYPTNERLLKLHWAVSPGKVERVDVRYSDRGEEVAWIKANQAKYKGKWVVLLGNRVLGMGNDLKTAMRMAKEQQYKGLPLIHLLE